MDQWGGVVLGVAPRDAEAFASSAAPTEGRLPAGIVSEVGFPPPVAFSPFHAST